MEEEPLLEVCHEVNGGAVKVEGWGKFRVDLERRPERENAGGWMISVRVVYERGKRSCG